MRTWSFALLLSAGCVDVGLRPLPTVGVATPKASPTCGPVLKPADGAGVVEIGAGYEATCARRNDGAVYCWGRGHDERPSRIDGIPPAQTLTMGGPLTCVSNQAREYSCWGISEVLSVSEGAPPIRVKELDGAMAITTNGTNVCARWPDGLAKCGGPDLGKMQGGVQLAPAPKLASVQDLQLGSDVGCALLQDGRVSCWGDNDIGQLGDGTTQWRPTLAPVSGLKDMRALFLQSHYPCAQHADGSVSCWGSLPAGGTEPRPKGARIPEKFPVPEVCEVEMGGRFGCARGRDGSVSCWGENFHGELGREVRSEDYKLNPIPGRVHGIGDAAQLAVGHSHACVLSSTGKVLCWGTGERGELGDGEETARALAQEVNFGPVDESVRPLDPEVRVTRVAVGSAQSCALLSSGEVRCWGFNREGQVNPKRSEDKVRRPEVLYQGVRALSLESRYTSLITEAGELVVFGAERDAPKLMTLPSAKLEDFSWIKGRGAYRAGGRVFSFGSTSPIGDGTSDIVPPSAARQLTLTDVAGVAGNHVASCAFDSKGALFCWGDNYWGVLGNGTEKQEATPRRVEGLPPVRAVGLSPMHTCALTHDGRVYCWGSAALTGDILTPEPEPTPAGGPGLALWGSADPPPKPRLRPVEVQGVTDAVKLWVGGLATCVMRKGGEVWCWGGMAFGRRPINVPWLRDAREIALSERHGCAIVGPQEVRCFGDDDWGQLGDPFDKKKVPYAVARW